MVTLSTPAAFQTEAKHQSSGLPPISYRTFCNRLAMASFSVTLATSPIPTEATDKSYRVGSARARVYALRWRCRAIVVRDREASNYRTKSNQASSSRASEVRTTSSRSVFVLALNITKIYFYFVVRGVPMPLNFTRWFGCTGWLNSAG